MINRTADRTKNHVNVFFTAKKNNRSQGIHPERRFLKLKMLAHDFAEKKKDLGINKKRLKHCPPLLIDPAGSEFTKAEFCIKKTRIQIIER